MNNCGHCGANLTPADMSQPTCRYCGTVLAHYARAAEKVAVVNALMGDANRNGIPDVLEGAARMGGPPMAMPPGGAQPVVVVHSAVVMGGQHLPPLTGGPVGQPGFYGHAMAGQAHGGGARTGMMVAIIVAVLFVVAMGAGMAMWLVAA
jgi:hypothetical protein